MVNTYRSLTFVQFFVVSPLCRRSIEILKVSSGWIGSTTDQQCKKLAALSNPCAQAFLCLWRHCVRGHAGTQPLICVGCPVHYLHYWLFSAINKGGFFEIAVRRRRRHTFASLWGASLRFASLLRANSRGDSCVLGVHLSNVSVWVFRLRKSFFVKRTYLKVCWRSTIDLCLMNLPKRSSF